MSALLLCLWTEMTKKSGRYEVKSVIHVGKGYMLASLLTPTVKPGDTSPNNQTRNTRASLSPLPTSNLPSSILASGPPIVFMNWLIYL